MKEFTTIEEIRNHSWEKDPLKNIEAGKAIQRFIIDSATSMEQCLMALQIQNDNCSALRGRVSVKDVVKMCEIIGDMPTGFNLHKYSKNALRINMVKINQCVSIVKKGQTSLYRCLNRAIIDDGDGQHCASHLQDGMTAEIDQFVNI